MPGLDTKMDPYAEFTKLEDWDNDGKPFLREVSLPCTLLSTDKRTEVER